MSATRWRMPPREKHPRMATLYRLQGGLCPYCGKSMVHPDAARARRGRGDAKTGDLDPTLEHVVPRSRGGSGELTNMLLVHRKCNEVRADGALPVTAIPVWRRNVEAIRASVAAGLGIHGHGKASA